MTTGRIHSIESFGTLDGPGIRYVLFLQGCPLKCIYCHNPDTWRRSGGTERTVADVFSDILKYRRFISGVTLSGGEPLMQPQFSKELLQLCKEEKLHTAIDTAGSIPLAGCKGAVDLADLILLDIKALDDALCIEMTGRDNRYVLELLNHREETGRDVTIRHVLLPGYTLDEVKLTQLADFLKPYQCVKEIELLPFHKMGEYKWEELGQAYQLKNVLPPTAEETQAAKEIFKARGFTV